MMDPRLSQLEKEIAGAIQGITPEQLILQHDGKWSVAEILEHLFMTYTGTSRARTLPPGRTFSGDAPFRLPSLRDVCSLVWDIFRLGEQRRNRRHPKACFRKNYCEIGPQITAMDRSPANVKRNWPAEGYSITRFSTAECRSMANVPRLAWTPSLSADR
jgi:hypothetical protein